MQGLVTAGTVLPTVAWSASVYPLPATTTAFPGEEQE